jgi:hypothetical protein
VPFDSESDLESAILLVRNELFGQNRIYLDIKKRIGAKAGIRNIPDGYLIDLNGSKPRLFVVENELAAHDPLRHIAVQILQFSLSFEADQIAIKRILHDALSAVPDARVLCEKYAQQNGFRNLDHMLEWLVFESPFSALVIIDEIPDNLENILAKKFQFGVEVLSLSRYEGAAGERVYHFEPFLADVTGPPSVLTVSAELPLKAVATTDIDTVVVPAREEGFREVFLGENRWHAVRIHGAMRPQIKFVAAYQVAPVSAITHIAPVRSIEPWKDTGKVVLNFSEPAREIQAIPMSQKGKIRSFQSLRYTTRARIEAAQTLDDIWLSDSTG